MAFRRRYVSKKKKRATKKRFYKRRRVINPNLKRDIYYFKRYISNPETITGNAVHAPYLAGYSFNLGQLPNVGEFTALFDQYRITYIQVKFFLKIDPGAQTAATASYPRIFYCRDYDDDVLPPSLNVLREHNRTSVRVLHPNRAVTVGFKPAIADLIYSSPTSSAYSPQWKQWIDCNNSAVPHYGLKWAIDDFTNTNYRLSTEVRYWFQCRGMR